MCISIGSRQRPRARSPILEMYIIMFCFGQKFVSQYTTHHTHNILCISIFFLLYNCSLLMASGACEHDEHTRARSRAAAHELSRHGSKYGYCVQSASRKVIIINIISLCVYSLYYLLYKCTHTYSYHCIVIAQ